MEEKHAAENVQMNLKKLKIEKKENAFIVKKVLQSKKLTQKNYVQMNAERHGILCQKIKIKELKNHKNL